MSITYRAWTHDRITVNFSHVITCPECKADRGLCLTTSGDGRPVTGSCPDGHVWDERRVTGSEIKAIAIDLDRRPR